jgi:micrococcal nuclease
MYEYKATIRKVIDGDTIEVTLDLGFRITTVQRLRLLGINAPELHKAAQIKAAKAAKTALAEKLPPETACIVQTTKSDDWGRWLATIILDGENVNAWLVEHGYAERIKP